MATVEINVPDQIEMQIAQLVEQDDFASRESAIEQLLSTGIKAYKTGESRDEETHLEEGDRMPGHEDEYVF